jgi:muramoyltetrapeptide carboxypeptidase LdcA involved in peptidoglycan recycling
MIKPRALRAGDRIALVSPASPFSREEFDKGVAELARLGFEAVYDEAVFARSGYVSGSPQLRAASWMRAWSDPDVAALVAVRGGYGSVHLVALSRCIPPAAAAQALHWLQRQHVSAVMADLPVRHHGAAQPDDRRTALQGR